MKTIDWVLIVFGILIIVVGTIFILSIKSQGSMCIDNPIDYYQLKENTSCWCINNMKNLPLF